MSVRAAPPAERCACEARHVDVPPMLMTCMCVCHAGPPLTEANFARAVARIAGKPHLTEVKP